MPQIDQAREGAGGQLLVEGLPLRCLLLAQDPTGQWVWVDAQPRRAASSPVLAGQSLDDALIEAALDDLGLLPRSFRLVEQLGTVRTGDCIAAVWQVLLDEQAPSLEGTVRLRAGSAELDELSALAWRFVTG
jgi:hypothetical protein